MQLTIRASEIAPVAKLPREALSNPREVAEAVAFLLSAAGEAVRRTGH